MRKLLAAIALLAMVNAAAATTITHEEVAVDLESSEVDVKLHVEELTSSRLTYFTDHSVEDLSVTVDGEPLDCQVYSSDQNNQISCETSVERNFTAHFQFTAPDTSSINGNTRRFETTESFIRPTERYSLDLLLPQGFILSSENETEASVYPSNADISTDGQRIRVRWDTHPELGTSQEYRATYESAGGGNRLLEQIGAAVVILVLLGSGFLAFRKLREEELDAVYGELEDDEKEVIDLLREHEGSMLQKDLVEQMDYSKAKISGTVSQLEEKEIVKKEKEGRSNRVSIRKNYRF